MTFVWASSTICSGYKTTEQKGITEGKGKQVSIQKNKQYQMWEIITYREASLEQIIKQDKRP